jgi:hypothetical protein
MAADHQYSVTVSSVRRESRSGVDQNRNRLGSAGRMAPPGSVPIAASGLKTAEMVPYILGAAHNLPRWTTWYVHDRKNRVNTGLLDFISA